ncbi:hypothetical protein RJT34_19471 [Clitoria ternatea]|uniref:Uncharacterized protein n=1 Tax=Clitoria ternatea TaxID=43366 RepID=A0AAN9P4P8_CLITE
MKKKQERETITFCYFICKTLTSILFHFLSLKPNSLSLETAKSRSLLPSQIHYSNRSVFRNQLPLLLDPIACQGLLQIGHWRIIWRSKWRIGAVSASSATASAVFRKRLNHCWC